MKVREKDFNILALLNTCTLSFAFSLCFSRSKKCSSLLSKLAVIKCILASNPLHNCVWSNHPPPRSPTPCWRIAAETTSIFVLIQSWDSSTHRLCLTGRPKAHTCWRFSPWMAGNQHGQANTDSPTLVSKTSITQTSLQLKRW